MSEKLKKNKDLNKYSSYKDLKKDQQPKKSQKNQKI